MRKKGGERGADEPNAAGRRDEPEGGVGRGGIVAKEGELKLVNMPSTKSFTSMIRRLKC